MMNFGATFIWTAINLLVLYFALRKILFKTVTGFMNHRTQVIRNAMENAEKSTKEALELKQQYEAQLRGAREEAARILEETRVRAAKEYEDRIGAAEREAEELLRKAGEEMEKEKMRMLRAIKNQVAELALLAASRVMEANMDTESNRKLVDSFLREEGAA